MRLLAFGEVMLRLMCDDHKLLTQTDLFQGQYTGTGVNIAAGLYQMGDEAFLATTLPNHHVGKAAAATLRKLGIHDDFVRYDGEHMGIYFLEEGIGNRASQVTYLNRKDSSFGLAQSESYDFESMLQHMDAVHICGITLAISEATRTCAFALAKAAKAKGIKIFFDCNYRPSLWKDALDRPFEVYQKMAEYADVMFASSRDGEQLNIKMDGRSEEEILRAMQDTYHIEVIFGTRRLGELYQGYMLKEGNFYESEAYPLTVFDRIGAGDAFASGAIHSYYHIEDHKEAITFATVCGVMGHTTYGDSPVLDKQEILRYCKEGKKDIIR